MTPHMQVSLPKFLRSRFQGRLLRVALAAQACLLGMHLSMPATSAQGTVQTASKTKAEAMPSWPSSMPENNNSTQPHVTFENGLLSISANNSSLTDVLMAVRACTGADVDLPGGVSEERVTAQLGPGPARKVLSDLLGWSNFDYIVQGSETDAQAIQSITLMIRTKNPAGPNNAVNATVPGRQPASRPARSTVAEPVSTPVETPEVEIAPLAQPSSGADMNIMTPQAEVQPKTVSPGIATDSSAGKSPAEMIQELQQMYQQRRQIQQEQNASPTTIPSPK